ncbi:MAG: endolytic transglycosylase MltG [Aquihabitans sp.]
MNEDLGPVDDLWHDSAPDDWDEDVPSRHDDLYEPIDEPVIDQPPSDDAATTRGRSRRRGPRRPPRRGDGEQASGYTTVIAGGPVEDDYVDLPEEGKVPRWLLVMGMLLLVVGLLFGGVMWWYDRQLNPPGGPGAAVSVEIPRGSSLSGIGTVLERKGVIPNAIVFNFYASRKGEKNFKAGVYEMRENSSADLALATLAKGPTGQISTAEIARVSIPEGLTIDKTLNRIAAQVDRFDVDGLEAALASGKVTSSLQPDGVDSFEGLLFPATYELAADATEADFLNRLADELETRVSSRDAKAARASIKATYGIEVSTYDLIIVASMVQSEAAGAEEAPKVAAVIYNRLANEDGSFPFLGIDAVDRYGAALSDMTLPEYWETTEPYNTRGVAGLPPTPIGGPSAYALDAAFSPADGPWMYYVLTDPGVHTFSVTLAEHNQAKAICKQKNLCD